MSTIKIPGSEITKSNKLLPLIILISLSFGLLPSCDLFDTPTTYTSITITTETDTAIQNDVITITIQGVQDPDGEVSATLYVKLPLTIEFIEVGDFIANDDSYEITYTLEESGNYSFRVDFFDGTHIINSDPEPLTVETYGVFIYSVVSTPTNSESVTLKNNNSFVVDISNWDIGDRNDPHAYNIPNGTTMAPYTTKRFEHSTLGFGINDDTETIYLYNSSNQLIDTWGY